jgi:hypothetical protein
MEAHYRMEATADVPGGHGRSLDDRTSTSAHTQASPVEKTPTRKRSDSVSIPGASSVTRHCVLTSHLITSGVGEVTPRGLFGNKGRRSRGFSPVEPVYNNTHGCVDYPIA